MSNRRPAPRDQQPEAFAFTEDNLKLAHKHIAKYPAGRQASAVLTLLEMAQRQHHNWLPIAAMVNLSPVGKYHIQLCGTTPCWLRGAADIKDLCKKKLDIDLGETTKDGMFSLCEVECLGACANAPMIQINDDFYEDLDINSMEKILDDLATGKEIKTGSQIGRKSSEVYKL